ncbi:unnamed protein product [Owenia fusiformis]|uniref:Uncharacterized protein n=1 Tax=Owenia fusiformis TaxID=6347 RepID=A0A8J1TB29_OWEFU|nr:unnamed protein product [Owenia fusiformis]
MVRIAVIGAGIVGLSTAVNIQRKIDGAEVIIYADKFGVDTTSDGAAGIFLMAQPPPGVPDDIVKLWLGEGWKHYDSIASSAEASSAGIHVLSGYVLYNDGPKDPLYKDYVYHYRNCTDKELQKMGFKYGEFATTLIVEGRRYLPWITKEFIKNGGKFVKKRLSTLGDIGDSYEIIVNCSGLGSRELVGDAKTYPIRGQVIRVKAPWVKHFYYDTQNVVYVIPGVDNVTLGGTKLVGDEDKVVRVETRDEILQNCCTLVPSLAKADFQWDWVGQRPGRSTARVEAQIVNINGKAQKVVHNYGHGAVGITLSWGSAVHATNLLKTLLSNTNAKL